MLDVKTLAKLGDFLLWGHMRAEKERQSTLEL